MLKNGWSLSKCDMYRQRSPGRHLAKSWPRFFWRRLCSLEPLSDYARKGVHPGCKIFFMAFAVRRPQRHVHLQILKQ